MSTIALTRDTFEDTVTKPGITVVDLDMDEVRGKLAQQEAGTPR